MLTSLGPKYLRSSCSRAVQKVSHVGCALPDSDQNLAGNPGGRCTIAEKEGVHHGYGSQLLPSQRWH
jgi:hypothetical protein